MPLLRQENGIAKQTLSREVSLIDLEMRAPIVGSINSAVSEDSRRARLAISLIVQGKIPDQARRLRCTT